MAAKGKGSAAKGKKKKASAKKQSAKSKKGSTKAKKSTTRKPRTKKEEKEVDIGVSEEEEKGAKSTRKPATKKAKKKGSAKGKSTKKPATKKAKKGSAKTTERNKLKNALDTMWKTDLSTGNKKTLTQVATALARDKSKKLGTTLRHCVRRRETMEGISESAQSFPRGKATGGFLAYYLEKLPKEDLTFEKAQKLASSLGKEYEKKVSEAEKERYNAKARTLRSKRQRSPGKGRSKSRSRKGSKKATPVKEEEQVEEKRQTRSRSRA